MKEYHQFTLLPGRCETERCISLTKFWYQAEAKGKYTKCMALETAQNTLMTCCPILQWQNKAMCSKSLRKREQKVFVSRRLAQLCLLLHYVIVRRSAVTDDFCLVPLTTTPFSWMQTDHPSVPVPLNRKKKIYKYWLRLASVATIWRVPHRKMAFTPSGSVRLEEH